MKKLCISADSNERLRSKNGPKLAKNIQTAFCRDVTKKFFHLYFKISRKIDDTQTRTRDLGNTEIANNQQLLSSDDLYLLKIKNVKKIK